MDASPFSLLPGELRNLIWEHALHEPSGVPIGTQPGLLQTCKAIRSEAELMFYALNHFRAQIWEDHITHDVCQWLHHLGEAKRKLILGLRVHCTIAEATMFEEEHGQAHRAAEEDDFMRLMHLLDSIRKTNFGRRLETVVRFTVSGNGKDQVENEDLVFDDCKPIEALDGLSIEEQECYRAAKFLILCCVYGKEELVNAMQNSDGVDAIAELDRRIQQHREEFATEMLARLRYAH